MFKFALRNLIKQHIKTSFIAKPIVEADLKTLLNEIKTALITADVALDVVKTFLNEVKTEIIENKKFALNQQDLEASVFGVIKEKLIKILECKSNDLIFKNNACSKYMFVGMNGSGKTTSIAKLACFLQKNHQKKIKTISLDQTRPAAYEQLHKLCTSLGVECYKPDNKKLSEFINEKIKESHSDNTDILIFDTAGLLPHNEEHLSALKAVQKLIEPIETIYVLDAMAGQDAIEIVEYFHQSLNITSLIVSKSDSDAPMGAALSMTYLLKIPIKFLGIGETVKDLKKFYTDRIVNQILGEGDFFSIAEKMSEAIDNDDSTRSIKRMMAGKFDLIDMMNQLNSMKKIGPLSSVMKHLPMFSGQMPDTSFIEQQTKKWEILINSMTKKECKNPKLFKKETNRKIRVVKGSGLKMDDLNKLIKKWEDTKNKIEEISKKLNRGKFDLSKLLATGL